MQRVASAVRMKMRMRSRKLPLPHPAAFSVTAIGSVLMAFLVSVAKGFQMSTDNSEMADLMASLLGEMEGKPAEKPVVKTPSFPVASEAEADALIDEMNALMAAEESEPEWHVEAETFDPATIFDDTSDEPCDPDMLTQPRDTPEVEALEGIIGQLQASLDAANKLLESLKNAG